MSTSYNVQIIYGFPLPDRFKWWVKGGEDKTNGLYLDEWLEARRLRPACQFNAGRSNGGQPDLLVGILMAEIRDFTRGGQPYLKLPSEWDLPDRGVVRVREAAQHLGVDLATIGVYVLGDAT